MGTLGDALREAGLTPNQLNKAYPEDELIEKFLSLIRELGRFPVVGELKMKSRADEHFPTHNVFARLGSKQQLASKILSYCDRHVGYDDVAALCGPIASKPVTAVDEAPDETTIGYVYLMKSGAYYKLGRSNAAGRREYELSIQMPEKLVTVTRFALMILSESKLTGTSDLNEAKERGMVQSVRCRRKSVQAAKVYVGRSVA